MQGRIVDFHVEDFAANITSWYMSKAYTLPYFTAESLHCSLQYMDRFLRKRAEPYQPIDIPYGLTPAIPIDIKIIEKLYRVATVKKYYLSFGTREVITPGSSFRFLAWGDECPEIQENQPFLLGKKRALSFIDRIEEVKVEKKTMEEARNLELFPVELLTQELKKLKKWKTLNVLCRTQRYIIAKTLTDNMIQIGKYTIPIFQ